MDEALVASGQHTSSQHARLWTEGGSGKDSGAGTGGGRGQQEMMSAPCPDDLSVGDLPSLREALPESWLVEVRRETLDAYACFRHFMYAETLVTQMWSAPVAASQVRLLCKLY